MSKNSTLAAFVALLLVSSNALASIGPRHSQKIEYPSIADCRDFKDADCGVTFAALEKRDACPDNATAIVRSSQCHEERKSERPWTLCSYSCRFE